jgi:KTSC domain
MAPLIWARSSVIKCFKYEPEKLGLLIWMHNGRCYRYFYVPPIVYEGLLVADSKGRFYNTRIKGKYPSELL